MLDLITQTALLHWNISVGLLGLARHDISITSDQTLPDGRRGWAWLHRCWVSHRIYTSHYIYRIYMYLSYLYLTNISYNSAAMEHFVACIIHSLQAVLKRNPHVPKAFKAKTTPNCLQGRKSVSCLSCKQVFETLWTWSWMLSVSCDASLTASSSFQIQQGKGANDFKTSPG
jgi:hypothetical protein